MQSLSLNSTLRDYLLLFLGCVLFHVLGTWRLPLIDRDEPRFAEASREMRERQDYVVPYFNNQYRFDKPPLTYWAQVASYRIFGEDDFAARFPSTVAGALTAVVLLAWGTRISGGTIGWVAAIIFTLSLQTFIHAKAAVADMWLVLFMTIAAWAGFELLQIRKTPNPGSIRGRPMAGAHLSAVGSAEAELPTPNVHRPGFCLWWWIFYVALSLAFLAKGPIGLLPLIPLIWIGSRSRTKRMYVSMALGILLTLGLICLWAVPALIQTHGEFWRVGMGRHVVGRSIGAMEGHGAKSFGIYLLLLPFYFVAVFVSFFPWSIKLPWLIGIVRKRPDEIDRYLLCGALAIFCVFTLVATKLPHYTLPAFPLLALLLARHWISNTSPNRSENSFHTFKQIAITTAAIWILLASILPPIVSRYVPSYTLFQNCRELLRPEMEFASIDYAEPSVVWYFRSRVRGFLTPLTKRNAQEFISRPGPRFIIMPTKQGNFAFPDYPVHWERFSATGLNIPKGKKVDLTLLVRPE